MHILTWIALGTVTGIATLAVLGTFVFRRYPTTWALKVAAALRRRLPAQQLAGIPPVHSAVAAAIGMLIGACVYVAQVWEAQEAHYKSIRESHVLQRLLVESAYHHAGELDMLGVITVLQRMNLVERDASPQEVVGNSESRFAVISSHLKQGPISKDVDFIDLTTGTPQAIVQLAQYYGFQGNGTSTVVDAEASAGKIVANATPDRITSASLRSELGQPLECSRPKAPIADLLAAALARRNDVFNAEARNFKCTTGRPAVIWRDDALSDRFLLHAVYRDVSAFDSTASSRLRDVLLDHLQGAPSAAERPIPPQLLAVVDFQLGLLGEIHRDPGVKEARAVVDVWIGFEQLAIVMLSTAIAGLLMLRWLYGLPNYIVCWFIERRAKVWEERQPNVGSGSDVAEPANPAKLFEDEVRKDLKPYDLTLEIDPPALWILQGAVVDKGLKRRTLGRLDAHVTRWKEALNESRVGLTWAYGALPAIGFLGTVHGILNALEETSAITSADRLEQAAGIAVVSGSLGLAFSTTLMALGGLLVLGFLDMLQHSSERAAIQELDRQLFKTFLASHEPRERGS